MTIAKTYYMIQIQTEPSKPYRFLRGWDAVFTTRLEAEAAARRAEQHDWLSVRVIGANDSEAHRLGWL